MTKKLRIRFIVFSALALFLMQALIIGFTTIRTYNNMVGSADQVVESIYDALPNGMDTDARYFIVSVDSLGVVEDIDLAHILSVKRKGADAYAASILSSGLTRGFVDQFRYGVFINNDKTIIVCVARGGNIEAFKNNVISLIIFSSIGFLIMLCLLIAASFALTRPVAESYRKQKEFITSAGHELKTPLTVIGADTDILLMEDPDNEWLKDIGNQTKRLSEMTHSIISLARMDEQNNKIARIEFPVSDVAEDVAKSFNALAVTDKKTFTQHIARGISYCGDENLIRRLFTILLDNAFKYSSENGVIDFSLTQNARQLVISVTNTSESVEKEQLSRFFERFYRSDSAVASKKKGYGLGLSIAKQIIESHKGKICAKSPESGVVKIVAVLK